MHERVEKTVLLPCMVPISGGEAVWASGCQLSAVPIANSLIGGCGLSHERVDDGCKSTCVKFVGMKTRQNWGCSKFNSCIGLSDLILTSTESSSGNGLTEIASLNSLHSVSEQELKNLYLSTAVLVIVGGLY